MVNSLFYEEDPMRLSYREAASAGPTDIWSDHSKTDNNNPVQKDVPTSKQQRKYLFKMDPRRKETVDQFMGLNALNLKENKKVAPDMGDGGR